jgi:hypothetical protein
MSECWGKALQTINIKTVMGSIHRWTARIHWSCRIWNISCWDVNNFWEVGSSGDLKRDRAGCQTRALTDSIAYGDQAKSFVQKILNESLRAALDSTAFSITVILANLRVR